MDILRYYRMAECDERGWPLDWERCRTCLGVGVNPVHAKTGERCSICDGHGSLKAAALHQLRVTRQPPSHLEGPRCEDCGHPMSEGTWEDGLDLDAADNLRHAERFLREGREPPRYIVRHYSPCDEGCGHVGPFRVDSKPTKVVGEDQGNVGLAIALHKAQVGHAPVVEASWRPVDVRTLNWPHDLRPESLAVLCLRCYAKRLNSN